MTTRILTGTYSSGYTLSASYTALSIAASGVVHGVTATNFGYGGGVGVLVSFVAPVTNSGQVFGGGGAGGYPGSSKIAPGPGGSGGMGADLTAGGYLYNQNTIAGGAGGQGGGAPHAARGGGGGDGVHLGAAGTVNNSANISGGQGGTGGAGTYGGTGGTGGNGVVLAAGGSIVNSGSIRGGQGGAGGAGGSGGSNGVAGNGGDGVVLGALGTLTNTGTILGGSVGALVGFYGDGVRLTKGGRIVNGDATDTGALIHGSEAIYGETGGATTVSNFGTVDGLEAIELEGGGRVVNGSTSVTTALIEGGVDFGVTVAATLTNFGTVDGYVTFDNAKDRLIAEAGSHFRRQDGGAGTLELAGGAETITGMGPGAVITGDISMSGHGFATYQVDAAASLKLTGVNQLQPGASLIDNGGFGLAAGASLTVGNGGKVEIRGQVSNAGTIALAGAGSATELLVLANTTVTGGGFVTLSGAGARILGASSSSILDISGTVVGIGSIGMDKLTLKVEVGGVIDANAVGSLVIATQGKQITNLGIIETTLAGAKIVLDHQNILLSGEIYASAGVIDLEGDLVFGGSVGSGGAGLVYVNVGGGEFNGVAEGVTLFGQIRVSNGSNLILEGIINNNDKLNIFAGSSTTELIIGAAGVSLVGGGSVNLDNSANNRIVGQAAADTLTNFNRITGAGQLGGGIMTLVNNGIGAIVGNKTTALVINTGTIAIDNAGLIESSGAGGVLIMSPVSNIGTLEAAGSGTLTLAGAVSSGGVGLIKGGTLYAKSTFVENVTFAGTTGVLELGHSRGYTGQVTGLSKTGTNSLDLTDIAFTSGVTQATYSGTTTAGTLTVTDGTHTAHIKLIGDYLGSTFTVSSDGHGGTTVVDPATSAFTHAMASFTAAAPNAMATAPAAAPLPPLMLAHG
jgi:hypothetical protein